MDTPVSSTFREWRFLSRRQVASGVLALLMLFTFTLPVAADEPPPECGPAQDGLIWRDPQSGIRFVCQFIVGFGWGWHVYPPDVLGERWTYTLNNPSGLKTWEMAGLHSGFEDGGVSEVYSRGPDSVTPLWQPPGWMTGRTILDWWDGFQWRICVDTNWRYSNVWTHGWVVGANMFQWPVCGPGYYRTRGGGFVWDGYAWQGGEMDSPYLWLDGGGGAGAASAESGSTSPAGTSVRPAPPPANAPSQPIPQPIPPVRPPERPVSGPPQQAR
jgi:hypothetical protein